MNIIASNVQTMSSREIAEFTAKRHPDVKRDIISMLHELVEDVSRFARIYKDSQNRDQTEYVLDKDHTFTLIAGYSAAVRRNIIRRWQELEAKQPALPTNYIEALESLVQSEKEKAVALEQLQIAAPKVEYHDKVLATDNGITTTEIAAELGMSAVKLNRLLESMKVQRKMGKRWVLTVPMLNQGLTVEVTHIDDGGMSRHSMKWTEAGRKLIHELVSN
jgi:phage antirepressor YoqD-like protein